MNDDESRTYSGELAVALHRLQCAEIRAEHAERNWGKAVDAYNAVVAENKRIWDEYVPPDVKAALEEQQRKRKEQDERQMRELMDMFDD